MKTLRSFIKQHRIRFAAQLTDSNPNMRDDWARDATHWKCVLQCGHRRMTTYFSQGSAIAREPTAEDLLDCLASDASGVVNALNFEDWCRDYGYDSDSRKAEQTYKTCEKQASALQQLLGDTDAYEELLWKVERQ